MCSFRSNSRSFQNPSFKSNEKKCIFNKRTIKVRDWPLRLAQRTLQDPCICVVPGSNAQRKSRALEGCRASSKSPSMVKDGDKVAAGWNGKEYSFLDKGLSWLSMIFFTYLIQLIIWLVATSLILLLLFVWGVVEPWCTRTDFVFRISNIGNTPPYPCHNVYIAIE